ncbi:MAG TPA: protein kinase [Bryobacteraceae bacterium]|jgi:Tol biopolymer transport system component
MTLTSGARLGPYEISSLIGAGGMGEVYKARDARLGRDVAVKVLPASFAADHQRLRRFEQEAQAVAALSHPNILAVYDLGQHDGSPFLVSELLEGESLRELLARGVPSHRKSIALAIQIAHGLAAAHSKNIAHRDLKPDNIFITRDGQVKILDFGLAKSVAAVAHQYASPADPTIAAPGPSTDAGTVMGTAGYMSPEQVRGAAVDCRTDIFSFGAILYEMLTGARAFKRDTAAETMTAILNEEPPEAPATGRQLPPALDRTIRHCLEKSPDQRFQSARDLAFDLESAANVTASGAFPAAKVAARRRWWYYAAAAAAVILAAALVGWKISSPHPVTGTQFHQLTFRRGALTDARFTPDGASILYTAAWQGAEPEIYTVPADGNSGHPLGISNARLLAISRPGEIAVALAPKAIPYSFLAPGTLARASNGSGAPKPEIENVEAADYTPDGSALAIVRYLPDKPLCQLEYPIGHVLYSDQAITNLRFSPDGRHLAFIAHSDQSDDRGAAVILRTTGEKVASSPLYSSAQGLAWTPSGNEVWFTSPLESGQIQALSLSGKTRRVLAVPGRLFLRDIAADGQLLAEQGIVRHGIIAAAGPSQRDLSWLDFGELRAISNDGQMILFEEEGQESKTYTVYVRNTDGSPAIPIGDGYGLDLSPDKNWALSQKLTEPINQIWLLPVGPGEPRRLSPPNLTPTVIGGGFTPDGKRVIYIAEEPGRPPRAWLQSVDGGSPRPITPENTVGWLISPDGKWLLAGTIQSGVATLLVPIDGGPSVPIAGLKPDDYPLGWTRDNLLFVMSSSPKPGSMAVHVTKLDPHTGARIAFRDIPIPPIGGLETENLIITPDGNSYAYHYHLSLSDLYTISGAR